MNARQIVNLSLGIAAGLALGVISVFFSHEPWALPADAACGAFLLGLLTPGSPVDRGLDALVSGPNAEAADAVADALRSRPASVVRREREGSATIDLLSALVCAVIGAAILYARGH